MSIRSSNVGYPRIGEKREWKKTLESFWSGQIDKEQFTKTMEAIRLDSIRKQLEKGIDLIPIGDFSLYDHVLNTALMFGYIPERFQQIDDPLEQYFAMARGTNGQHALEMTKWFNTNYHYIVPEIGQTKPRLVENRLLKEYNLVKETFDLETKPVLLGPITFLLLSKQYERHEWRKHLEQLVPVYVELFKQLSEAGVSFVQIDEPILVQDIDDDIIDAFHHVYDVFYRDVPNMNLILQTYFDSVSHYQEIVALPVAGIGLDFVHDDGENMKNINTYGFPRDKILVAGIVDGRNVWKSSLTQKATLLHHLANVAEQLIIQPSCSLLHVPVTTKHEHALPTELAGALSFADEKLDEIRMLTEYMNGNTTINELIQYDEQTNSYLAKFRKQQEPTNDILTIPLSRVPYSERRKAQQAHLQLPLLPTTTIGSFPQTSDVRQARMKWKKGEWNDSQYKSFIKKEIAKWIDIQEQLQLDVLVHGEFERTDMVEFFGEKLQGMACTTNGWVQSYGSRCVRPPIIFSHVAYRQPMTVEETVYAQSLTNKPVKGMLTGPVTMLYWSFVRDDIPRKHVLIQLALAIREEVLQLEKEGIRIIQVDEPALREGLPLKKEKHASYWEDAVMAFRLATSSVKEETQIHTHMCYSQFEHMMHVIDELDADVISIESSRSHGELIAAFETYEYKKEIGLGVYDIHSPRIPTKEEISEQIERALRVLRPEQFWVNPDCGLKTRKEKEAIAALKAMVEAAHEYRERLLACGGKPSWK
ncbi:MULTISPECIES: 5-methyltetrahydropteroyltriglutamate--homocysteine S-methyltransferase [Geobacillus]|uniref:5-methyltetrahydropteroyltriglutamate--homocysteine methyltransferase n=1 Tax=Geobacillus thermocatenulatus TaxID=33938 RepID=A0A226QB64_9BACL|nr:MULTISPECIES: 5-methyltetrahydropteroyltriglutamate--homocysteine S-methyltransferase [Geobacillus]ASS98076.1 5-methyltetrahydropteroyltriglutamate--homocysteine S-methyltransferase [Geobacillus thermocatenulatus]KLR74522.1 5-methyltetrahydropteroyltriglutamate--homocysteine methyltransferase [Geobacillus sp. T6]OXB88820.1 5-methyltetrahydropteroyltriglutamate--homocysteine S-methyltransferase [Geobacillus thermocatenulatus]RAN22261.1 5-methyltetrahydropteroyltriglutamate--homocysteine methy